MKHRPQGWVVVHRMRWYERVLLGYGAFIGLFFALVCLGGFSFVALRTLDGTLLPPAERSWIAVGKYVAIALFALWFGSFSLRWSLGSLLDLFGAEVVLYGPVEELKVHRGAKGRWYTAVVAGGSVDLSLEVFGTLAKGDRVWMRVGRFQRSLKALARPDRIASLYVPARPAESLPSASASSSAKGVGTAAAGLAGKAASAHGPVPDNALRRSHVPSPVAPWSELERFALTWDGVAGPELFALHDHHVQSGTLPDSLAELRGILFVEQRCQRHATRVPRGEALARVRAIVEAIRARVPPDA